jgi:hypothetical protein
VQLRVSGRQRGVLVRDTPVGHRRAVKIFNVVDGRTPQMFADLQYGSGGQDRAFANTSFQGTVAVSRGVHGDRRRERQPL